MWNQNERRRGRNGGRTRVGKRKVECDFKAENFPCNAMTARACGEYFMRITVGKSEKGFSGGSNVAARDFWKGVYGVFFGYGVAWCEGSLWFQFQIHISGTIKSTARSWFSLSRLQWTCTLNYTCSHFTHIVNVQAFSLKSSWLQVHFPFVRMRTLQIAEYNRLKIFIFLWVI